MQKYKLLQIITKNKILLNHSIILNLQKTNFEKHFPNNATFYTAQYALSGYCLFKRVFEYQRYFFIPNGFRN